MEAYLVSFRAALYLCGLCTGPLFSPLLFAQDCDQMAVICRELELIEEIRQVKCPPPILYNFYGQTGYFQMPSARPQTEGIGIIGASVVSPYHNYFLGFQLFNFLELTGVYRVFDGIEDTNLSPHGFGDFSDKGVNVKAILWDAALTDYRFPCIAIGIDDFLGSRSFTSWYIVLTQVIRRYNLEVSLGWGWDRMKGIFGGINYSPFAKSKDPLHKGLSFTLEYDNTNYRQKDPHPHGRDFKYRWNWGIKYRLGPYFQVGASRVRGKAWAASAALNYNFGESSGVFPKIWDPPLYHAPIDHQPIGDLRPLNILTYDLGFALKEQGFLLLKSSYLKQCNTLRLEVSNKNYLKEQVVHERLAALLSTLTPTNLFCIQVVIITESIPCQEYHFRVVDLLRYHKGCMNLPELFILSTLKEVPAERIAGETVLFEEQEGIVDWLIRPRVRTFFGSASGKFKYAIDLIGSIEGYFGPKIYYNFVPGITLFSSMQKVQGVDILNPSQLLNVNSDRVLYYQTRNVRVEQGYLQRAWSLGKGFYQRLCLGFFDVAYAGLGVEWLYYPLDAAWAVGIEGAMLKKRDYGGYGFESKIRRYEGDIATYVPYSFLFQGFFNIYCHPKCSPVGFKWSIGQFLARDIGIRTEAFRYFDNGLRLSIWYTVTNGNDKVNGSTYYDKGISFSLPLDFFLPYSSHSRVGYGMSAWLRDVGYGLETGKSLYNTITEERN